ncbi:MAG: DUF2318 domain-containing protein [Bacteroidetes bacterium]|nr:DUF2318 domain-containing protein [Bacteroidota bacterium]
MKTIFTRINAILLSETNLLLLFLLYIFSAGPNAQAQDRRHPVSEISTTAKYYSYTYIINATTKKEIEYFIVQDGSGNIKTAFNACEVCYKADKGYSQKGDVMHCNNCGNEYPIEDLGSQGQGGCWPGYLPHTINGDEIVIQISGIEKGAYLFPEEQYSGVNDPKDLPDSFVLNVNANELILKSPISAERKISIFDLNGHILNSISSSSVVLSLNISRLSSGVYIMTIEEADKVYFRMINVGR